MQPRVGYPAVSITRLGASAVLNTASATVVTIPGVQQGLKPQFIRIAISQSAAYVRLGTTVSSATVTTADTLVSANEAVWFMTGGAAAVAMLSAFGGNIVVGQVSATDEGLILPATTINAPAGTG